MANNILDAINELTLATNMLSGAIQSQDICCAAEGVPYYPPGYDPTSNPETSTFCDRAHSLAENWRVAARDIFTHAIAGDALGLGIITLVTALLSLPLAILIGIVTLIATFILEVAEEELYNAIDELYSDIVCSIVVSANPSAAKSAIDAVIDAKNIEVGFGVIGAKLMKDLIGSDALNQVFAETYPILSSKAGSDCSGCGGGGLFKAAQTSPHNVLVVGDYVDAEANAPSYGWQHGPTETPIDLYFTTTEDVTTWFQDLEIGEGSVPGQTGWVANVHIQVFSQSQWNDVPNSFRQCVFNTDGFTAFHLDYADSALVASTQYRVHIGGASGGYYFRARKMWGQKVT